MRLIKPSWVQHANEKNTKCPIYSLSVHPDGTRLATGGLDHKVKIWSTLPILDEASDNNEANPKLLCTMNTHSGSVLAVRWAHSGRFLASGSDDQVVVIWRLDAEAGGKVWGSNIVNVENWKPLTRLVGHTSDIIDVAWSRDDAMLASVGLDNSIWIWDGFTGERIHRITGHEGFVKGVTWDPVGNYLATQSDDKSVRIWNTETWQLEHKITGPFESSPSSTFFRRLSWSPDGAFIAASNAMNGPVFVGAVIEREFWGSDVSFVGHANTIQVAASQSAFNPRLFFLPNGEKTRATASTVLALGSNDFSISIWRNILHKPIVVLKEVFGRNLMDLCWSQDGLHLYGCSEDGTICAVEFDPEEFPDRDEMATTDKIIKEFQYTSKRLPRHAPRQQPVEETSFGAATTQTTSKVNTIQPRKNRNGDNRRLVTRAAEGKAQTNTNQSTSLNSRDAFAAPEQDSNSSGQTRADMLRDAPSRSDFGNGVNQLEARGSKRKAITLGDNSSGRNMASSRPRISPEVKELRAPRVPASGGSGPSSGKMLGTPQIQSLLRAKPSEGTDEYYLEAENAGTPAGSNKVTFIEDGADIWLDYLPTAILAMAISESFCAVACEDGNLLVYSHAGRHLFTIKLESPCYDLSARGKYLFVVTTNCHARVYNVPSGLAVSSGSIAHLVAPDILDIDVRPNGTPVVITTDSSAYAYDTRLQSWVPVCDKSHLSHDTAPRGGVNGPLADIEQKCRSSIRNVVNGKNAEPEWWNETRQMGILDMRIRASVLLGSKEEYRHWLLQYATFLGEQEFTGRAEELLKDLIGPVYSHPGKESTWDPDVLGYKKRDLAMTVSTTLLRANQAMSGLVGRYQAILQAIKDEESDI